MPSFSCDGCGDVVKKPKLDSHSFRCRASMTCLDCSTTFYDPDSWKPHTSCISEAQKYQKSLYKPPPQHKKNPGAQEPRANPNGRPIKSVVPVTPVDLPPIKSNANSQLPNTHLPAKPTITKVDKNPAGDGHLSVGGGAAPHAAAAAAERDENKDRKKSKKEKRKQQQQQQQEGTVDGPASVEASRPISDGGTFQTDARNDQGPKNKKKKTVQNGGGDVHADQVKRSSGSIDYETVSVEPTSKKHKRKKHKKDVVPDPSDVGRLLLEKGDPSEELPDPKATSKSDKSSKVSKRIPSPGGEDQKLNGEERRSKKRKRSKGADCSDPTATQTIQRVEPLLVDPAVIEKRGQDAPTSPQVLKPLANEEPTKKKKKHKKKKRKLEDLPVSS